MILLPMINNASLVHSNLSLQLDSFLVWAEKWGVKSTDVLYINVLGRKDFFTIKKSFYGKIKLKSVAPVEMTEVSFIINKSKKVNQLIPNNEYLDHVCIFRSPVLEILENKRLYQNKPNPLRWGLNQSEKVIGVQIAHEALKQFLLFQKSLPDDYFASLPERFKSETDLDIALWVDGELRGSVIVLKQSLGEGIAEATVRASRDKRFKPLDKSEIAKTTIEVTLIPDLKIPLSAEELKKNSIYHDKGYYLDTGYKKGWFVPIVFNCTSFKSLDIFLKRLAVEKVGLKSHTIKLGEVFIFEVDDFTVTEDQQILSMCGPIIDHAVAEPKSGFNIETAEGSLKMAVNWLCHIQASDGNIPPVTNPFSEYSRWVDWPRLAFTAWALATFGHQVSNDKYLFIANKSFEFLRRHIFDSVPMDNSSHALTLAYFGQLSKTLGYKDSVDVAAQIILEKVKTLPFHVLNYANIISFLSTLDHKPNINFNKEENLLKQYFKNVVKNESEIVDLASVAELVHTFHHIDPNLSRDISQWLKTKQLSNGAFPASTMSNFVYTRGTSKIFEVLALDYGQNQSAVGTSFYWLQAMQYNTQNTFFIKPDVRQTVIGGFRHDYFNQEAWIDSAGHFLMGGSRLLTNYFNKN